MKVNSSSSVSRMSPLRRSPLPSGPQGAGAANKKGRPRLSEPMKRKSVSVKTMPEATRPASAGSTIARTRKGSQTPKKKRVAKGSNEDGADSDASSDGSDHQLEELYEVSYLEDFIDAVDVDVDDVARLNSQLLEVHCEQIDWIEKIENEMSKLLRAEVKDDLDPGSLSNEKKDALKKLEDMLIQVSQVGDRGVRHSDEVETVLEEKLRILNIDHNNLAAEKAKHDPDTPAPNRSKNMKKPSINPKPRPKGTPSKTNLASKLDNANNGGDPKLTFPIALSTAGSASPAPSFGSSSSFDNKSGKDSQTPVDAVFLDDTRYRACKFKNPPNYVFHTRFPTSTSNSSTPKKLEQGVPKKTDEEDGGGGGGTGNSSSQGSNSKMLRTRSSSSQGSRSSSKQTQGGAESQDDISDDSSSSDSDAPERSPEPTYCVCEKISHGKMVQCDNELCPIEWFHFGCVNLKKIPKGDWFCPRCRGENFSVMKPKSEFLKELEQYNKEKEKESSKMESN